MIKKLKFKLKVIFFFLSVIKIYFFSFSFYYRSVDCVGCSSERYTSLIKKLLCFIFLTASENIFFKCLYRTRCGTLIKWCGFKNVGRKVSKRLFAQCLVGVHYNIFNSEAYTDPGIQSCFPKALQ